MSGGRRPWLAPLVPLYAAGVWLSGMFAARRQRRLRGWVVSVGSLSAGGAGKTPVVMMIVEMLSQAGLPVDVLSRGYGRAGRGVERVDPAGSAARFGDEPMLMARQLGVPVWVGADRYAAGLAAEAAASAGPLVHVLDDGFQHRRLWRDVDVVLLTREDVEDRLLPAGNRREPVRALNRADAIVLREEEADGLRKFVPPGKAVWVVRRSLTFASPAPLRPLVFCGIARPDSFLAMLAARGVAAAGVVRFPDHHRLAERDVTRLLAEAHADDADGFITTEKDSVKLTKEMLQRMTQVGPVAVAALRLELLSGGLDDLGSAYTEVPQAAR